jgi:hypothetical protein
MAQQIQLRNDTTAGWEYANPVLAQAEIGIDTTLGKFKIGNGTSTWSQLQFQSASIADFIFEYDDNEGDSIMTVTDHDMVIRTVRDNDSVGSDCDVNIEAADDVFIRAFGDEIGIYASDEVEIRTNNYDGQGTGSGGNDSHSWRFDRNGHIEFPDGTIQTTSAQGITPLTSFLTWREGRTHLPDLNTHFGWNSQGLWFQNASEANGINSYPVFTDFTIPQDSAVVVEFDVNINDECSDVGVCVYVDETTPQWAWEPNLTRIAAQFDCTNLELIGRTNEVVGQASVPDPGFYRVVFSYNPNASTDKVTVSYKAGDSDQVIETLTLDEALPAGPYRIGFAADQNSSSVKTYMTYMSIDVAGGSSYGSDLDYGNSGTTSDADLVLPVAIKDGDGDDFITFTRTSNNTARIATPQDDLSLRSARDITLIAGSDGPGNVYIGWGDATISPNASNRVATIGDIPNAELVSTANNSASYGIYQAAGFTEVTTEASTSLTGVIYTLGAASNVDSVNFSIGGEQHNLLNGSPYLRRIYITDESNTVRILRSPSYVGTTEGGFEWSFECDLSLELLNATNYNMTIEYAGAPTVWWDSDVVNPSGVGSFSNGNFRGAKIEYHAYVSDSGTHIGTIYIANDSDDNNVTHIETSSGGSDVGTAVFWDRSSGNETQLSLYRIDGESVIHKIQWTAQMYYSTEVYND